MKKYTKIIALNKQIENLKNEIEKLDKEGLLCKDFYNLLEESIAFPCPRGFLYGKWVISLRDGST